MSTFTVYVRVENLHAVTVEAVDGGDACRKVEEMEVYELGSPISPGSFKITEVEEEL